MTAEGPERFRLLATFIAGRSVAVAEAPAGQTAYTNGSVVFVSPGRSDAEQRREMLVQSALLGAGSLDPRFVRALRGRPSTAHRYLALEGRRALADLAGRIPLAGELLVDQGPTTATAAESLSTAKGRKAVVAAPEWFGVIKPAQLSAPPMGFGERATTQELRLTVPPADPGDEHHGSWESKILKLFATPLPTSRALSDFLRDLLGTSRSSGDDAPGGELQVGAVRHALRAGTNAVPLPSHIRFIDERNPAAAVGVGGARYPEWDVHRNSYRPDWCRVIDFPLTDVADMSAAAVAHDDVLRRRLARVGLGPRVLRGRSDGDELDIEALVGFHVDLRSGFSPTEGVYLARRRLARDLGVLILLDASGSATDTDTHGLAVHDHQRRAAATLAATLEELGDQVAVYAFRSHGRHAVHLPAIKTFSQRFGAGGRARLNRLEPSGYTRLGAGIRGAGEILKAGAGTSHRLLIVLSDGFPYDDGYEGRYAEADTCTALEELRADGVACLCLSIGTGTPTDELERVFGSAGHACAATLSDLSPQMDELFVAALAELAAPRSLSAPATPARAGR